MEVLQSNMTSYKMQFHILRYLYILSFANPPDTAFPLSAHMPELLHVPSLPLLRLLLIPAGTPVSSYRTEAPQDRTFPTRIPDSKESDSCSFVFNAALKIPPRKSVISS